MKRCTKCGETKAFSEFYANKNVKTGYNGRCKQCCIEYQMARYQKTQPKRPQITRDKKSARERNRAYYLENKQRILEQQRQYQLKNKQRVVERGQKYRTENKQRLAEYKKQYRAKNKERIAEKNKRYHSENRERLIEYHHQYHSANKDVLNTKKKEYRLRNKERINEKARRYRAENKERIADFQRKYQKTPRGRLHDNSHKARRRSITRNGDVTVAFLEKLFVKQTHCAYCNRPFGPDLKQTIDHVIPLSKGGTHTKDNIVLACRSCNSRKHARIIFSSDDLAPPAP